MQTTTDSQPSQPVNTKKTKVNSLDILHGADKIAEYIYGDAKMRKRIYNLAESKAIPVFKLGAILCARRSTLRQWILEQERLATA